MDLHGGIPTYITATFLLLVSSLVCCIIYGYNQVLIKKHDKSRKKKVILASTFILLWLFYINFLSTRHILDQFSLLPPRMGLVVLPALITVLFLSNNIRVDRLLLLVPQQWLIFIHSFRFITGVLFYLLFLDHIIPVQMTFMGKNFDVLFGILAPVTGILFLRNKIPPWVVTAYHFTGIIMMTIVVITAVLSAPFPFKFFQGNESNTMIAYFPFVMLPGFVIPISVLFHIFGLKKNLMHIIDSSKKLNDKWIRYSGIPLVALLMAGVFHSEFHSFSADFFFGFSLSFGLTILLWHGNRLIITNLRLVYPEYHQTLKRILYQFVFIALFTIAIVLLIDSFLYIYIFHHAPSMNILLTDVAIGMGISGIMLIIYESIYFFSSWKQNILEVEGLKSEQVQKKLDVLKNQLNPHFLFNSLNSLTSLVENDSEQGLDFVQKMSDVYRYILQSNDSELNTLRCEKKFIEKYFFVLKIRYPESLFFEISIPEEIQDTRLVQLSLQMLIDNAIKHNVISRTRPLYIKIFAEGNHTLVVSNSLQKKRQLLKTGNFGLSDLQKRYQSFGMYSVQTEESNQSFRVKLPLITAV